MKGCGPAARMVWGGARAFGFTAAIVTSTALGTEPLQHIASYDESSLNFQYMAPGVGTRCGSDLFVVEYAQWKCLRKGADGRVTVVEFGQMNGVGTFYQFIVRGPVPGDRRILFATSRGNPRIDALDPMTGSAETIGTVSGWLFDDPILVDHDGDGIPGLVVAQLDGSTGIVRLPPASGAPLEIVQDLGFSPRFAGQFDADPQAELAVSVDGSITAFRDSATLQWEAYSITGSALALVDWDDDGVDEIVAGHLGTVQLVDLNSGAPPVTLNHGLISRKREHSVVHWQHPLSRDIAFWSMEGLVVIDPRRAQVLAEFAGEPGLPTNRRAKSLPIDWDNDGDGDLLWSGADDGRLVLLRQGGELSILQHAVGNVGPAGYVNVDGNAAVATIARYNTTTLAPSRQARDPLSLKLRSESPVNVQLSSGDSCHAADVHPNAGTETLCADFFSATAHLLSADGTPLWTLDISDPRHRFHRKTLPDHTCRGTGCSLVLLQEIPFLGFRYNQTLRLIDGATGEERWRLQIPGFPEGPQLLTDLNADGVMDVVYADTLSGFRTRINAIDSDTRTLHWQRSGRELATALARSRDLFRRLAVLDIDSTVTLLNPIDGHELASARMLPLDGPTCGGCSLHYLRANDTFGAWVLGNSRPPALSLIDRDLRSPIWRDWNLASALLSTQGDRYLHVMESRTLHTFALHEDGIFADRFEGW